MHALLVFKIFQKLVQKVPIYCYKPSKKYSSRDTILLNSDKTTVSVEVWISTPPAENKELNMQPHEEARVKKQPQQEIHRKKKKYAGVKRESNIVTVKGTG